MEFESPDVEREFPGLYASEAARKSNESDFSDESHEKVSKKDLLIGKRKDKKDKKDRGYATLEGESSPEEDTDIKSPSKTKKSKPFKFSSKKEKREKSREKECKEKDQEKEKKKSDEKDRDKKKEAKVKLKIKEKKKAKHVEETVEISASFTEDLPIFGVPLSVAVERSKCHDGVDIPLIVRNCIDHVEETGLLAENVYKVSGIKSKVQQVRRMYNNHEPVKISDFDLPVATSLVKQFLRELPEPVLTTELVGRFEEGSACNQVSERGDRFKTLISELPSCNRALLGWLLKHFDHVTQHEKFNKMNAQSISIVISPLMQTSQRLLSALLCHVSELFPNLVLTKYVPPLTSVSPGLPDSSEGLSIELAKQESLLMQLHREMNQGLVDKAREEQLWGVQRIITQLKRKLRSLERTNGCQRSLDETDTTPIKPSPHNSHHSLERIVADTPSQNVVNNIPVVPDKLKAESPQPSLRRATLPQQEESICIPHKQVPTAESLEVQDINRELTEKAEKVERSIIETEVLMNTINKLKMDCKFEREEVRRIKQQIHNLGGIPETWGPLSDSSDEENVPPGMENDVLWKRKIELKHETKMLQEKKKILIENIIAETDACIDLNVQIKMLQLSMDH
ncbi:ralA-binding protein 1-like isoform X2 [Cimex lectularius]|uniref:Rho-GAP domain-containing protein n=1 Tax=Cimex lectularius TaxID=79782 RepID=A0A8I6S3D1_CIMLE|nr:ralA-binding protein 1-like isoform X2 [Cimex lectularius]